MAAAVAPRLHRWEIRWKTSRLGARRQSHPHPPRPRLRRRPRRPRQISTTHKRNQVSTATDQTTSDTCSRASSKTTYTHISSSRNRRSSSKPWTTTTTSQTMDSRTMISKVKRLKSHLPNLISGWWRKCYQLIFVFSRKTFLGTLSFFRSEIVEPFVMGIVVPFPSSRPCRAARNNCKCFMYNVNNEKAFLFVCLIFLLAFALLSVGRKAQNAGRTSADDGFWRTSSLSIFRRCHGRLISVKTVLQQPLLYQRSNF